MLDFRPALASTLTVLCTIFSKLVDVLSCYSILTLIEGLMLFWKKQIIIDSLKASIILNSTKIN